MRLENITPLSAEVLVGALPSCTLCWGGACSVCWPCCCWCWWC